MSRDHTIYKKGFTVKPSLITETGVVVFTDGTNQVIPNQRQCEAYGYNFDIRTGTCSTFRYNTNLENNIQNVNNNIQGTTNTTSVGTNNTYIMGERNTVRGTSRNNIVIGNNNEIQNNVNNAFVFGTLGNATADNTVVLGGNTLGDILGERQVSTLLYGCQTTDGSTTNAFLNNVTDSFYAIPENAAMYFQADILAVRVGGSSMSGALGNFKSWVERGVVINESGTASISRTRTSPASSGTTTGWSPVSTVSGTDYVLTVKGATGQTVEWVASIRFTQIRTSVAL